MQRRRSYYRSKPRAKRPTDRVIRAGQAPVTSSTGTAYLWTATTPCTVTNFKLDIGEESADQYWPVAYALVYVPEGYNVNSLTFPAVTDDMYNPTKMVIISGYATQQEMKITKAQDTQENVQWETE